MTFNQFSQLPLSLRIDVSLLKEIAPFEVDDLLEDRLVLSFWPVIGIGHHYYPLNAAIFVASA